jgi:hypothetical protein
LLPVVTAIARYPAPLVWMAAVIFALIALRRLEGIDQDRGAGIAIPRAFVGRVFFDLPRGQMR